MYNHHAVLLLGESFSVCGEDLIAESTETEMIELDIVTIADVRTLIKSAFATPLTADTKTIVIQTKAIAIEAQHALLKIFEEPPATTKFIVVIPTLEGLLPTLLSRIYQPDGFPQHARTGNPLFVMFQSSSYAARLELITRITKDKDTLQIELLRAGVLWLLAQTPLPTHAARLAFCTSMMNQRGASKKMLLEEIALTLPVVTVGA